MHDSGDEKIARDAEEARERRMREDEAGQKRTYEKVRKHSTASPTFKLEPPPRSPIKPAKKKPKKTYTGPEGY